MRLFIRHCLQKLDACLPNYFTAKDGTYDCADHVKAGDEILLLMDWTMVFDKAKSAMSRSTGPCPLRMDHKNREITVTEKQSFAHICLQGEDGR